MTRTLFVIALVALTGCSRAPSAKIASDVIKGCVGTVSIEVHIGLFYESVTTKCAWEKKDTP